MLVALIPWGEYQFIGLQVVLSSLGIHLTAVQAVAIAGVLAFCYIAVSGIRSPALVSIMKDSFMVLGVVAVGLATLRVSRGGATPTSTSTIPAELATIHGSAMTFAISTIVFQAIVFYLALGSGYIFPARSERAVKSSTVWMPLYMLIYPFLVAASYYALHAYPRLANPNTVFMVTARGVLPSWLVGVVAAGASLSGLLVLAVTALAIGALVSRNLLPHLEPTVQRRWTTLFVAVFLVLAALMTLYAATLMLTVLNLFYGLIAQVVPATLAVLYAKRVRPAALTAGMIVGVCLAVALYLYGPAVLGVSSGLIAMAANAAVVVGWRLLSPGATRPPVSGSGQPRQRPVTTSSVPTR
jgi:SSS family solute:Na+ symporter